jgi:hypothetical protein
VFEKRAKCEVKERLEKEVLDAWVEAQVVERLTCGAFLENGLRRAYVPDETGKYHVWWEVVRVELGC